MRKKSKPVAEPAPVESTATCPTCGQQVPASKLSAQKLHCPKHDVIYHPDAGCDHCKDEAAAAEVEHEEAEDPKGGQEEVEPEE